MVHGLLGDGPRHWYGKQANQGGRNGRRGGHISHSSISSSSPPAHTYQLSALSLRTYLFAAAVPVNWYTWNKTLTYFVLADTEPADGLGGETGGTRCCGPSCGPKVRISSSTVESLSASPDLWTPRALEGQRANELPWLWLTGSWLSHQRECMSLGAMRKKTFLGHGAR